jgi:hypothetical protein
MTKRKKPDPRGKLTTLSQDELMELFEFLRNNSYTRGCIYLHKTKGITISPNGLCKWWSGFAARLHAESMERERLEMIDKLGATGRKLSKRQMEDMTAEFFQRHAALGMNEEVYLKFMHARHKMDVESREIALKEKQFERLKRQEDESRKALQQGGTEAEMVKRFKEILGFNPEGT